MFRRLSAALLFLIPLSNAYYIEKVEKRDFTGQGTWFDADAAVVGRCGTAIFNGANIVALAPPEFLGADGTVRTACGKKIEITAEGKTIEATVADRCDDCISGDLGMDIGLFEQFAPQDVGSISVTWDFV